MPSLSNLSNNHSYATSVAVPEDPLKTLRSASTKKATPSLLKYKRDKIRYMSFCLLAFTPFKFIT